MNDDVNPILNHDLYARAESAARAVYETCTQAHTPPARRMRLMDKAARDVLRQAGTPYADAHFYACSISADVLEAAPRSQAAPA